MARLRQSNKALFSPSGAANVRIVLAVFLSIALMTADHRFKALESSHAVLSTLIYPLHLAAQVPRQIKQAAAGRFADRSALLREIEALRLQQLLAGARLQKLNALEKENQRLRQLRQSSAAVEERVVIAEILTVDVDPDRHRILLNKGSAHGVSDGQALLAERGIVGQIVQVNPLTSSAILITDSHHALPVRIERTGLRTLARGTGNLRQLELAHLPNDNDVRAGDVLSTSGLGGRFPRGYPVARVTDVQQDRGQPFALIAASPLAGLDRIREVLVVQQPLATPAVEEPTSEPLVDASGTLAPSVPNTPGAPPAR